MLFNKGNDALQRENYDYAVALFNQVLEKEPALYDCRKALRTAQQQKAGGGGGLFKKGWSFATSSPGVTKAQMALRKDPAEALHLAEQVLNSDPNSSGAHRVAAQAAMALELPRTAALSLEILVKNSPKDKDLAIEFASALAGTGEAGRAEKILQDLARLLPNDPDLAQALKNVTASKTLNEGGYEKLADGQGSYRDILKNEGEAVALEQEKRVVKTEDLTERLIHEYEARLPNEPKNLKLVRSLAELYTQKKQFDRALRYYEQISASEGSSDPTLERSIADTVMRRFDHQIFTAGPRVAGLRGKSRESSGRKAGLSTGRVPETRRKVSHRPADSVRSWASSTSRPAKSARPSRNFKRPRPIPTAASRR